MTLVILEKHVPDKNQYRFYCLGVLPNLFGEWTLWREWGRIGRPGHVRLECFLSREEAETAFEDCKRQKEKRGYVCLGVQLPPPFS